MREIKFRAWDKKNEKYFEEEYDDNYFWIKGTDGSVADLLGFEIMDWSQDEFELEQFTGLHDKNGKKIYEGDVVKLHVVILSPDDKIGFIEYVPEFGYCINFGARVARQEYWAFNDKHTIEVIGNIHENKELLDGGNNQD